MLKKPAKGKRAKKKKANRKQADHLFSLIIRSAGKCAKCNATTNLQCAHIISRRYLNLRWDIRNAVALCAGCHIFYTYRPLEWDDWVNQRIGQEVHNGLKREAKLIRTGAILYEELVSSLKQELNRTLDK